MSPSASVETRIMNSVITALEDIGSSGYYSTGNLAPRRVFQMLGNVMEIPEVPCIIVTPMPTQHSHNCPNGLERIDLRLAVTCVIDLQGGALGLDMDSTDLAIRNLASDVRTALQTDLKRGSLAIDTIIESTDIYDSSPEMPVTAAEVSVTIPFRHLTADPASAF